VWVLIEELHTDGWHIGGRPFEGPRSLMDTLGRSKQAYEMIDGHPTTRPEFAAQLPPIYRPPSNRHLQRCSSDIVRRPEVGELGEQVAVGAHFVLRHLAVCEDS